MPGTMTIMPSCTIRKALACAGKRRGKRLIPKLIASYIEVGRRFSCCTQR